jgi:GDP-4-dehydro-6-deoxy-D-mannose reductase
VGKPEDQRVLVTGAGGFVGRALLGQLQHTWPSAAFLATARRDGDATALGPRVQTACVDLCMDQAVDPVIEAFRPTTVIHLAAQSSVHLAASAQLDMWRGNFLATYNLIESLHRHAPDALFVFASSGECYGRTFLDHDQVTEDAPLQPTNAYGRSKSASEYMIRDVHKGPHLILRMFNQIGPGQDERFVTSSFAAQLARIERGEAPPTIKVGDLSAERDFCDIADMVRAANLLLSNADALDPASTFNICSGRTRSIRSVLDTMLGLTSVDVSVEVDAERLRPSAIARAGGSNAAIHAACGWRPEMAFEDTLQRLLDYWRTRLAA